MPVYKYQWEEGRNRNGQTDKRGQRKSIRRRRQTLIRKRSGSSIAVSRRPRTKDEGRGREGGNVLATGQQQLAIRRRKQLAEWSGVEWSGVGWSGEYENRMTDHDKRCLTSFNNHWQLQFAVWRRPGDICANTEIIIMTDCRQSSTRMEVLLGPSWPTCVVSCDRSGIKWPKVRHIDPWDPVFAVHIGNYHVEIPTDS